LRKNRDNKIERKEGSEEKERKKKERKRKGEEEKRRRREEKMTFVKSPIVKLKESKRT
jgi:hypothetical protein